MSKRPNILLIFTDQQRHDTIAALGNPQIRTPNLDRLVREGVAFTNAYSPSPVCAPARAAMHYGQYPGKTRCLGNAHPTSPDDRPSFVDVLTHHGYNTVGIGKCHFIPDRLAGRGFLKRFTQEEVPQRIEDDDYLRFLQSSPFRHVRDVHGVWREMLYMPQTSQLDEAHHPTQWVGDRTIDFIRDQRSSDRPWFAFSSFIAPHPPYAPPVPWDRMYDVDSVSDPCRPPDAPARQPAFKRAQLHHYYFDPPTSDTLWRMVKARYYACVSFIDHQVGRIRHALEATGQLDNTLILFSSDHGEMLGDLGLLGKANMYEPAVKVPLIARWGDRRLAGSRIDVPVTLVDIASTAVSAAGLPIPADFDGEDLADIAGDRAAYRDRVVFSQVFNPDRGMYLSADRRFKYIHSAADGTEQLFDFLSDPREDVNLMDEPTYADVRDKLRRALMQYLVSTGQADKVLNANRTGWRVWPPTDIRMGRTTSNHPCPWAPKDDPS